MTTVMDSSAVLAWLRDEPGAEVVHPLLSAAVMSAANWSETYQKLLQHGVDAHRAASRLRTLGVRVEPLTETDALTAANLWIATRAAGHSLGAAASRWSPGWVSPRSPRTLPGPPSTSISQCRSSADL